MESTASEAEHAAIAYATSKCRDFSESCIDAAISFKHVEQYREVALCYDMHTIATYWCHDGALFVKPLNSAFSDLLYFDLSDPDSLDKAADALIEQVKMWHDQ